MALDDQDVLGIYIHIPFCRSRCGYCDFNTYSGLSALVEPYVEALVHEIERSDDVGARPHPMPDVGLQASTLYFGGGTPTLLPLRLMEKIIDAFRRAFRIEPEPECSIEANPGTVDLDYLQGLRTLGLNRLSLGVQSFDDRMLRELGRLHTSGEAVQAYRMARAAGFESVSLDLIYGLPGQGISHWEDTLTKAIQLVPDHLSLYALTLEGNTPMARQAAGGLLRLPDDDAVADMYVLAEEMLANGGYDHYEISNWARADCPPAAGRPRPSLSAACRHNLIYWRNGNYLGFGAGAHSHWQGTRYHNVRAPRRYVQRIETGVSVFVQVESADRDRAMGETMMMGLRLSEGISLPGFHRRFGVSLEEAYGPELDELVSLGLIEQTPERVCLTPQGRLLANDVFVRFLKLG